MQCKVLQFYTNYELEKTFIGVSLWFPGAQTSGLLQSALVSSGPLGLPLHVGSVGNVQVAPLVLCRFAGPMERLQAEAELINRVNSTYLVRHRSREYTEYAISIK